MTVCAWSSIRYRTRHSCPRRAEYWPAYSSRSGWPTRYGFPATGQGRTQRPLWRLSQADAQADAGYADEPHGASARQHRSRGAGAAKQVSETAPELVLVNARLIFALVSALACRVTSFSRITAPPCRRLRRLQFVQALPLLGGDQDYRAVARPHQSYRSATSLHLVGNRVQILSVADRLLFHTLKYVRHTPRHEARATGRPRAPVLAMSGAPQGDGRHLAVHLTERHRAAVARARAAPGDVPPRPAAPPWAGTGPARQQSACPDSRSLSVPRRGSLP